MSGLFQNCVDKVNWLGWSVNVVPVSAVSNHSLSFSLSAFLLSLGGLPGEKVPQTGYELIPEYVFWVNFWHYSQSGLNQRHFEGQTVTRRSQSGSNFQLCIFITPLPHLVKIFLPSVFILNGHQVLTQGCSAVAVSWWMFPFTSSQALILLALTA